MLPVPGSTVESVFERNYRHFGFMYQVLRILRVLAVFRGSVLRILSDSQQYFGIRCCGYSLFFEVFRGSVVRVLQVLLAVFRPLILLVLHSQYQNTLNISSMLGV